MAKSLGSENLIKTAVRQIVQEEVQTGLGSLKTDVIASIQDIAAAIKDDIATMKDEIMGELKVVREEQAILSGKSRQINELDDRVEKLEKIHPAGQHVST